MKIKKRVILSLVFFAIFLSLPCVSAEISLISSLDESYILGQSIRGEVMIVHNSDKQALFSASLVCEDITLNFYALPVVLKKDEEKTFLLPEFPVGKKMAGQCKYKFLVNDLEGDLIEEYFSKEFKIYEEIGVEMEINKNEFSPGESVIVKGDFEREGKYNMSIDTIAGEQESGYLEVNGSSFQIEMKTNENLKAGANSVVVKVGDLYGNEKEQTFEISVLSVPREIELVINNASVIPGENLSVLCRIYDQTRNALEKQVEIKAVGPEKNAIGSLSGVSNKEYSIGIAEMSAPGNYSIEASGAGLKDSKEFVVLVEKELLLEIMGNVFVVTNVGNVQYVGERSIKASDGSVIYEIPLFLNLAPGEKKEIDMGLELPERNYSMVFEGENVSRLFEGVFVSDQRSIGKKISQGISRITGKSVINTSGEGGLIGAVVLVLVIGVCVLFLSQNRLKTKIVQEVGGFMGRQNKQIGELRVSLDEEKKKEIKIRKLFGRYVDEDILNESEKAGHSAMEKKMVSVMFTDIRGFSKLFDAFDEVTVTKMLDMYFKRCTDIVKKNGGMVNKFMGDAVMAMFNAPRIHKDHQLRAVKTALELKTEMNILNERLIRKGLQPINIGIGIDSGMAAIGNLGGGDKIEYTAIGIPVNIAARLQNEAAGDQILISERVHEEVKDYIEAVSLGMRNLKNINNPVNVFEVNALKGEREFRVREEKNEGKEFEI